MPSISETGHAKNVTHFEQLISFCTGYGGNYNPSKATLTIPNLTALHTTAQSELHNVINATVDYNNLVNTRAITFEPIRKLSTRLINAFSVTDATDEMIKDAKTINRKIQGKRAKEITEPTDPNTPAPNTISASQQSYDQLIEHFTKLFTLLKSEPSYNPNEAELNIPTLDSLIAKYRSDNSNVMNAYTTVSNARIARDVTLYQDNTGLVPIALDVKGYIKSVFGATSDQYKQVSKLAFRIIKK
jgi:hypothetical protein